MENPLLTQAAALLTSVVRQQVALPCSLEQLEAIIHPLAHSLARQSAQQWAEESVAQAEAQPSACPCGGHPAAQQRRPGGCCGACPAVAEAERLMDDYRADGRRQT